MRPSFELQVTLLGIGAVIVMESALDIDRVRVVAFNQVAVITVHGPDERGQRRRNLIRQAAAECNGARGQIEGEIVQLAPVRRVLADHQRLEQA